MTPATQTEPLRQQIEHYAYFLYEQRGCQPGHELEDWLEAEKQLAGAFHEVAETASPRPAEDEQQSGDRRTAQQKRSSRKAPRSDVH